MTWPFSADEAGIVGWDGDKRLALAALIAFYGLNGRRLTLTNDATYDLVMNVASGYLDSVDDIAVILQSATQTRGSDNEWYVCVEVRELARMYGGSSAHLVEPARHEGSQPGDHPHVTTGTDYADPCPIVAPDALATGTPLVGVPS